MLLMKIYNIKNYSYVTWGGILSFYELWWGMALKRLGNTDLNDHSNNDFNDD